jgi:hypothetical protein
MFSIETVPNPSPTNQAEPSMIFIDPIEASSAANPHIGEPGMVGVDPVEGDVTDRPVVDDGKGGWMEAGEGDGKGKEEEKGKQNFWDYFRGKVEDFKEWFGDLVGGAGNQSKTDER